MDRENTKIVAICSIKGGVGKSTSAIIFSTLLSKKHKVLLIDADPQASTTSYFSDLLEEQGVDVSKQNIYEVLADKKNINSSTFRLNNNLYILPSYIYLYLFYDDNIPFKETRLKDSLKLLKHKYDYIIIDTSPSLGIILTNVLVVSNYIIIPMTAQKWSVESMQLLEFALKRLKLKIPIFPMVTNFKKNNTYKHLLELISRDDNFLGVIHEREDLNKRIAENDTFDLNKDYIKEYEITLEKFFQLSKKFLIS
ncbi:CobQ/CobB/MinD/ParA nucleotide binding domain protein (plasmid) [Borreliella burgdorferi 29805]|uniref:ParA family protein n=1 Tax=Borreliella burgdorferi TaxID=139 RepID=UPI00017F3EB6|nr:ParA family protein [Borreliella burgdorferi]ACO38366.1 CobQ/CobB/MinD/ParA nucleotide binding domain protein [Borreliella burgdorferi 29805]MCR8906758.1 ParA family protein [Borreliella burgdorferi]PRR00763.1 chromosome partitioning protein ParA [Borreliella burgdorferi]PRR03572.1 chromosome partitioning protein ParA [Borreliella burgdorferi]PRR17394.1 chromosome partitioning protein ParA [Borreliella burgdorferi]